MCPSCPLRFRFSGSELVATVADRGIGGDLGFLEEFEHAFLLEGADEDGVSELQAAGLEVPFERGSDASGGGKGARV